MFKPPDYTSVAPYLIVGDAAPVLAFIAAVFGVEPIFVHHSDDGTMNHAEIKIDDTVVMLGQMPGATSAAHIHVYVEDVDAVFGLARDAGGTVVQEPIEKGDGDRRGGIVDPSGTTWWLSTQLVRR